VKKFEIFKILKVMALPIDILNKGLRTVRGQKLSGEKTEEWIDDEYFRTKCKEAFGTGQFLYLAPDPKFKILSRRKLVRFLNKDKTESAQYRKIIHDCDDFAWILHGKIREKFGSVAFGVCWYDEHAVNIWYSAEDDKVYLVEPQTDEIYSYPKGEKPLAVIL